MIEWLEIVVRLLVAHLLTDFFLQTHSVVMDKKHRGWRSPLLGLHALLAGGLAYLFAAQWDAWLLVGVGTAVSHWLIDVVKINIAGKPELRWFLLDQLAHIGVVLAIAHFIARPTGSWLAVLEQNLLSIGIVVAGVLLVLRPSSFFIMTVFRKWDPIFDQEEDHLPEAGAWIGYLERLMILIFILLNKFTGIGFLIAAKSILRFRDRPNKQKVTEYILLGTLLSFTIAVVVGTLMRMALPWA